MTQETAGSTPALRVQTERFYAVGRADLPVGLRAAQVGHALIAWVLRHGEPCENLVLLQVADEAALAALAERLDGRLARFHEPDLGGQLTALAVGPECWREVSSIGLMR